MYIPKRNPPVQTIKMKFQAHLPGLICLLLSGAGILCVPTTSPQQPPRAAAAAVADHHLQARGDLSGPPPRAGGLEKRDLTITYTNTTADTIICSGSDLVWTGYTNNISPYVADCMAIYTHFRANPGYFTVTGWTGSTCECWHVSFFSPEHRSKRPNPSTCLDHTLSLSLSVHCIPEDTKPLEFGRGAS